jgi:glutamate---cysteine ligase / carboxylate-amine ligase
MTTRRMGVEEELFLIDPNTRQLAGVSSGAVAASEGDIEVTHELFQQQIETSTSPASDAEDLRQSLCAGRRSIGEAAAAAGARAVAMPTPILP